MNTKELRVGDRFHADLLLPDDIDVPRQNLWVLTDKAATSIMLRRNMMDTLGLTGAPVYAHEVGCGGKVGGLVSMGLCDTGSMAFEVVERQENSYRLRLRRIR